MRLNTFWGRVTAVTVRSGWSTDHLQRDCRLDALRKQQPCSKPLLCLRSIPLEGVKASVLDQLLEFANIGDKLSDLAIGIPVPHNNFRLMPESCGTVCTVTSSFRKTFLSVNCEKKSEVLSNDIFTFPLLCAAKWYFQLEELKCK